MTTEEFTSKFHVGDTIRYKTFNGVFEQRIVRITNKSVYGPWKSLDSGYHYPYNSGNTNIEYIKTCYIVYTDLGI